MAENISFQNPNPAIGKQGTLVTAEWFQNTQDEIANVITDNGGQVDPTKSNQLSQILTSKFAPINSPTFTGTPLVPDTDSSSNGRQIVNFESMKNYVAAGNLGYTPVHQGGGTGQGNNTVYIGYATDSSGLKATIDSTDLGTFAFEGWCNNTFLALTGGNVIGNFTYNGVTVATKNDINSVEIDVKNWTTSNYLSLTGGYVNGAIECTKYFSAGINGGWNGARTNAGDYGWTNGLVFGNPIGDGNYRGQLQVTDVLDDGGANSSGINITGYDSASNTYQWYLAWNGNIQTPKGLVAFESDLTNYVASTADNRPVGTVQQLTYNTGTNSMSAQTKDGVWHFMQPAGNYQPAGDYAQASQIASGTFDGSQGSTTSGRIVGGTWLRVGNTLTQNLVIENIGGGTVTYPIPFSGNNNQVTVIVQDGTGSNSTFTTGSITTTGTGIHASGGGGTGRMHLTVSGPYGT